jgi:hypothetical protein
MPMQKIERARGKWELTDQRFKMHSKVRVDIFHCITLCDQLDSLFILILFLQMDFIIFVRRFQWVESSSKKATTPSEKDLRIFE